MKLYGIRKSWPYEVDDLIEFFLDKSDAEARVIELNAGKAAYLDDYEVEEWVAK